jgi:hypothetical protein
MTIFNIPYEPLQQGGWSVDASNQVLWKFRSRRDAIRFAVGAAVKAQQSGDESRIVIEGIDGRWRSFDHAVKGVG